MNLVIELLLVLLTTLLIYRKFGGEDPYGAGPAGLFAQFAQCVFTFILLASRVEHDTHETNFLPAVYHRQMGGMGPHRRRPPQQYNEYLKAFSAAMRDGETRPNLLYGGKSAFHKFWDS